MTLLRQGGHCYAASSQSKITGRYHRNGELLWRPSLRLFGSCVLSPEERCLKARLHWPWKLGQTAWDASEFFGHNHRRLPCPHAFGSSIPGPLLTLFCWNMLESFGIQAPNVFFQGTPKRQCGDFDEVDHPVPLFINVILALGHGAVISIHLILTSCLPSTHNSRAEGMPGPPADMPDAWCQE